MSIICKIIGHNYKVVAWKPQEQVPTGAIDTKTDFSKYYRHICQRCNKITKL